MSTVPLEQTAPDRRLTPAAAHAPRAAACGVASAAACDAAAEHLVFSAAGPPLQRLLREHTAGEALRLGLGAAALLAQVCE